MSRPPQEPGGLPQPGGTTAELARAGTVARPDTEIAQLRALIATREQEIARLRRARGAALLRDAGAAAPPAAVLPPGSTARTQLPPFTDGHRARPFGRSRRLVGPGSSVGATLGSDGGSDIERLTLQLAALQSEVDALARPGALGRVAGWLLMPWRGLRRLMRGASAPAEAQGASVTGADPQGERIASRLALAAQIDAQTLVESATPRCCVVVVSSGDADRLQSCLGALSTTLQQVACRVRVVGAVSDALADPLIGRIAVPSAGGETLAALRGISDDTPAETIVFLVDRLLAQPGWLAAVEETLARFPQAGAVACRVQDPLGGLVSAGGLIGRDAACLPRCPSPEVDALDCVQAVACGGPEVVAVRRSSWDRLRAQFGDQHPLAPGNVLIALLLRELGQTVHYQPFARFIDLEPPAGPERRADLSWTESLQRWHIVERFPAAFLHLATLEGADPSTTTAPRALLVDARVPRPDQDSASLDTLWYLRMLGAFGYEAHLLAPCASPAKDLDVGRLRGWGVRIDAAVDLDALIHQMLSSSADAALIVVRSPTLAARLLPALRSAGGQARCVFVPAGLGFLAISRAALSQASGELMQQALELRADEVQATAAADATILSTDIERDALRTLLPAARLWQIPIPRRASRTMRGFGSRAGVLFLGAFTQLHTIDAAHFLTGEVWPLVRRQLPLATLSIAGSEAGDAIMALHNPDKGISVLGQVDRLDRVFDAHRLFISPLRFGAGVKGAVLSSMLHGVPCVVSPMAAEGMGLVAGEDALQAEGAAALAAAVVRLHEDRDLWVRLADQGFRKAAAEHAVDKVARAWLEMLIEIGAGPPRQEVLAADFIAS